MVLFRVQEHLQEKTREGDDLRADNAKKQKVLDLNRTAMSAKDRKYAELENKYALLEKQKNKPSVGSSGAFYINNLLLHA